MERVGLLAEYHRSGNLESVVKFSRIDRWLGVVEGGGGMAGASRIEYLGAVYCEAKRSDLNS